MKALHTIPLIVLMWTVSVSLVYAVDDVAATKHNLSSTQTDKVNNLSTDDTDFVCGFCHSPHTEAGGPAPLWNRGSSGTSYTMYSSSTTDMAIAGAPASNSLACLTCHDGTVGFDQLVNGSGSGNYVAAGADQGWTFFLDSVAVGDTMTGVGNLGAVLTGDHPISVTYNPALDTAFQPLAAVQASLQLYGAGEDQVECASCHNPHEATNPTFLRAAIGDLCSTCHIK